MAHKQLSPAQLNQRRAAGLALAAQVHPEYFKWLGGRGGRKSQYRIMEEAATYCQAQGDNELASIYLRLAAQKYKFEQGTRVMMQVWHKEKEQEQGQ